MDEHLPPDGTFPAIVAHRGASSTDPENTLASFRAAIGLGAQYVETDVRLTADAEPVLLHDPDVDRTTDGRGGVNELTLEQVRSLNAGTPERPQRVPTLREALELIDGRAGVALEIKNLPGEPGFRADRETIVEATAAVLGSTGFGGPVLFLSFNPRSIAEARRLAPRAATGLLVMNQASADVALDHAAEVGHDFVLPGAMGLALAGEAFVERAHEAGVRVGTWTVDDPDDVRRFLDMGVDAVASNDPATALEVLRAWRAGS